MSILQSLITTCTRTSSASRLLIFLWAILLITSCRRPEDEIFGSPDPSDLNGLSYSDTFSLELQTVYVLDSFNTFGSDRSKNIITGIFKHPVFGEVTSRAFIQLSTLSNSKFRTAVPPSSELDSTVITFPYRYYYGDTTQEQTFLVYRLSRKYETNEANNSSKLNIPVDGDSLFSFKASINPTGNAIIKFRADTLGGILLGLTVSDYVNLTRFLDVIKGFAIVPAQTNSCVIGIDPFLSSVRVHYSDTLSEGFSLFGPGLSQEVDWFHYIEVNRSGVFTLSGLQNWYDALPVSPASNNMVYAQQGTGIRIQVKIPAFDDLKSKLGNVVLHKAELEITQDANPSFVGVPFISVYYLDQNGKINLDSRGSRELIAQISNVTNDFTSFSAVLVSGTGNPVTYKIPLTLPLQFILSGARKNYGFLISPHLANDRDGFNILTLRPDQFKLKVYYLKANTSK